MLSYCTYCSAEKYYTKTAIPAIQLYKSDRISQVIEAAREAKATFLILSGKYGIIEPNENIPYYDHLLTSSEVEVHAELIASQLKSKHITEMVFFIRNIELDRNLQPYLDCMAKACDKAVISLKIQVEEFQD